MRGFDEASERDGVLRVDVRSESRAVEFVVLDAPGDPRAIDRAAQAALAEPHAWVTVPTPEIGRTIDRLAEHGFGSPAESRGPEWLMSLDRLADQRRVPLAEGYLAHLGQPDPASVTLRVTAPDGTLAASGQLGIVAGVAVPDKILVDPGHRRRGLGGAMMTRLVEAALAAGAEEGLLMASPEGRALYESLGWTTLSPVVLGMLAGG